MKYLVIGLGNFGSALAKELTDLGNEVIGVDSNEARIEAIKDKIEGAFIMNAAELQSLKALPLHDIDAFIVAVGSDFAASVRITANLKQMNVKNIYARAFDVTHHIVLSALGVENILTPEIEAAKMYAQKINPLIQQK